ncbi:MAG: hypothetical protein WCF90_07515 [Methanomicrobiales archaeon]
MELVVERNAQDAFASTYAVTLSTSIHFFDRPLMHTSRQSANDLGINNLGIYSAEMGELVKEEEEEEERTLLKKFTLSLITAGEETITVQRDPAQLDTLAMRLVWDAEAGYIPPRTFDTAGGHNIFRDSIYWGYE